LGSIKLSHQTTPPATPPHRFFLCEKETREKPKNQKPPKTKNTHEKKKPGGALGVRPKRVTKNNGQTPPEGGGKNPLTSGN